MHFGSPLDPSQIAAAEARSRYVHLILKPHGLSLRWQVRLILSEVKPCYVLKENHLVAYPVPYNSLPQNNRLYYYINHFMLFIVTKITFNLKLNTVLSVFSLYIIHVTSQIKWRIKMEFVVVFLVQCPFS